MMNLYSYFKPLLHSDEDSTLSMQPGLDESASDSVNLTEDISSYLIAKPLGEAGNRGARSRNAFVCMYVCIYIYIYIYISVPVNYCHLDRLCNRQDGAPD